MKKNIITAIILLYTYLTFAQRNNDVVLYSLEFLDQKFHLNFDKAEEPILVFYKDKYYLYEKYSKNNIHDSLSRIKIYYKLQKISEDKYEFTLNWAGEITGSFKLVQEDDKYLIKDIQYVKRDD